MKQILLYLGYILLITLGTTGCKKENDPELASSVIEITVKNAAGEVKPNVSVYMFDVPSTDPNGTNPGKALKRITTNQSGVASFDLQSMPNVKPPLTLYFTVLEEQLSGPHVLGSVEIAVKGGETLQKELVMAPATLGYPFGYLPVSITSKLAMQEYNRWKSTQVVPCNGGLRVIADPSSETLVEAVGFGMLLSAYAKDKATFDGILTFYQSKRTTQSKGMMGWKVTCSGIVDPGSATDGDLDVAFALIVASKHWGESYLNTAKEILSIISQHVLHECTVNGQNILIVGPGYSGVAWGGCEMMDIMYHTPAFFRVFAEVTGDATWSRLAEDTYVTLNAGAHPSTGLVPDWQTASGTPGPGGRAGHFGYDACRAPWRLTLDYLWNGNVKAEQWAKKVAAWANNVGPANIVDGYELNGTPIGKYGSNSSFLGGFAVATMTTNQATADRFGNELAKLNDTYWFNLNTRCLYLFTLSGNFYNPLEK